MSLKIPKCEVDKENLISPFFDVIILGKENEFFNNTLALLKTYADHFPKLSIGACFCTESDDLERILRNGHSSGIIFVVLDDFGTFSSKSMTSIAEVTVLSNNVISSNYNFDCVNFIGFQRHLVSTEDIVFIEAKSSYAVSLGLLTQNINNLEPEMRTVEHLLVNLNVCKSSIFSKVSDAMPTGLDPESFIQIIRFSTNSPDLKTIVFNMGNIAKDKDNTAESSMIAESIWYILEGVNIGPIVIDDQCESTFCTLKEHDIVLEFLFSVQSNKHWVKIYDQSVDTSFVACSESEFIDGCQGVLSNRLFKKLFNT
jgi:formiminoglutamase